MRPQRCCFMYGMTSRTMRVEFKNAVSREVIIVSSSKSAAWPVGLSATWVTNMPIWPNLLNVSRTTRRMSLATDRSAGIASTCCWEPSRASSISACLRSASVRAEMVTLAPSRAKTEAIASPKPRLAPPTIATRSLSPRSIGLHPPDPRRPCDMAQGRPGSGISMKYSGAAVSMRCKVDHLAPAQQPSLRTRRERRAMAGVIIP